MTDTYAQHRMIFLTLDPLHIGAGGTQLGAVDNAIVREPGTNLPKIPGTSLSGISRSYAARRLGRPCGGQGGLRDEPDGKGGMLRVRGQCGGADCPVCYTFGSLQSQVTGITGTPGQTAVQGTVVTGDAHLLLFPVASNAGPVWVGTVDRLRDAGFSVSLPTSTASNAARTPDNDTVIVTLPDWNGPIGLGWLMFNAMPGAAVQPPKGKFAWSASSHGASAPSAAWDVAADRIVLVTDRLFSIIVNAGLEVRTSVSIDPDTGAARSGALFTYEAIPRAAWLGSEITQDNYRNDSAFTPHPVAEPVVHSPLDVVRHGLDLVEMLGMGGMSTRGFGRLRVLADWQVTP